MQQVACFLCRPSQSQLHTGLPFLSVMKAFSIHISPRVAADIGDIGTSITVLITMNYIDTWSVLTDSSGPWLPACCRNH